MKRLALLTALTLACATPVVQAASTVATLSQVNFTLIDLTPDDGIAASMTLLSAGSTVSAGIATIPGAGVDNVVTENGGLDDILVHNQGAGTGTVAALQDGMLQSMGSASGSGQFSAAAWVFANFALGANTQLVFNATAQLASGFALGNPYDTGLADVSVEFIDQQDGGPVGQYVSYYNALDTFATGAKSVQDNFTLTFTNASASELYGRMMLSVSASGQVSPVPEPSTWLMLGAGLALVAGAARRARKAN